MSNISLCNKPNSVFKKAVIETIPVIFGYVPLGIAFGLCFVKTGAPWYAAVLMSLFVFAGAAQFVAVTIMAAHGSLMSLLLTTFVINLRHIFYGISFVGKFPKHPAYKKLYMIYGLTDEAYSILTTTKQKEDQEFSFWVILISHFYWVLGTYIGALSVHWIAVDLTFLQFSLTALFVVLAIEQAKKTNLFYPLLISILASLIGLIYFKSSMLIFSIGLSTLILAYLYKKGVVL